MPAADDAMRLQSSAPSGLRNALLLVFSLVQLRVAVLLLGIIIVLLLAELNSETVNHLHDLARPCLAPQSAMSRRPTGGSTNPLECCQSLLPHCLGADLELHEACAAAWSLPGQLKSIVIVEERLKSLPERLLLASTKVNISS